MVRYVSTIISDAVVGFLSYWPAWMSMIMLFVWAKIAAWNTGRIRISVESDASQYYRSRKSVIVPLVLFFCVLALSVTFIALSTKGTISFTWYDLSQRLSIPESVADILLFFGPAICAGIWSLVSLIVFLSLLGKREKYAERRAALISLIASAVVCLLFVGVGVGVRAKIAQLIVSFEEKPILPLF